MDRRTLLASGLAAGGLAATPALSKDKPMSRLYPVLQAIIAAWHRQDVEAVLVNVTDDIIWRNTSGFAPAIRGKDEMRKALLVMRITEPEPRAGRLERVDQKTFDYALTPLPEPGKTICLGLNYFDHAKEGGRDLDMLLEFMLECHKDLSNWSDSVFKIAAAESEENKQQLQNWLNQWLPQVQAAFMPYIQAAFADQADQVWTQAQETIAKRVTKAGLSLGGEA